MEEGNENEPRRCTWRNPCCCQTIRGAVTAGAVLTILYSCYTALIQGGLAGIAAAATTAVESEACETAKWTGLYMTGAAIALIFPTVFLLCCRRSCMCVVWILCELAHGTWSVIAYLKMIKALSQCVEEATAAVKDLLPIEIALQSDTFTPAMYVNLGIVCLLTVWLTWLVSAFTCHLRRNKVGAVASGTFSQEIGLANEPEQSSSHQEFKEPTSLQVEEVALDLRATHSSRLLGYSAAAVHQPAEDLKHPDPAPGYKKRKFERWDK